MTAVLTAVLAIYFAAAAVQAVSGFGFALVSVPLLTVAIGPAPAVVCASLVSLAMTLGASVASRAEVDWSVARRLAGWILLGMPFGVVLLKTLPAGPLSMIIAVVVLGCTVLVWRRWAISASGWKAGLVGVVAGVLATATGTNGPPLVAAVHSMGATPRIFRATMAALLAFCGSVGLAFWVAAGLVTAHDWLLSALGTPVAFLGAWIGRRLVDRADAERFRRIVLSALVASSAVALAHAALA